MRRTTALCLTETMVLTLAGYGGKGADSAGTDAGTVAAQTTTALDEADAEKTKDTEATGATAITDLTEETTILIAAVASLKCPYEGELIPMFEIVNPGTRVEGTSDSLDKPRTQIEEGLEADVLMLTATKQINTLKEENMVDADSTVGLLEDRIILVTSTGNNSDIKSFEDIIKGETTAIDDSESVSAGQYAKEALTTLGLWDQVEAKASLGTSVTEVLNWVVEGSADAGIIYATGTATNEHVKVVMEAPEGSLNKKVIYPADIVTAPEKKDAAQKFVKFLQSDEAIIVSEKYSLATD